MEHLTIDVFEEILVKGISLKTFRLSCQSDWQFDLDLIGVLILKCPNDAKTIRGNTIQPGYIHLKTIKNLKDPKEAGKSYYEQCFESICQGNLAEFLVFGFGITYGQSYNAYLRLNISSLSINERLISYLEMSNHPKTSSQLNKLFMPILQTVMRKYKTEQKVGFTLHVQYIPVKVYSKLLADDLSPNRSPVEYKVNKMEFEGKGKFHDWCRNYFEHEQNEKQDFENWFISGKPYGNDLDYFLNFFIN